MDNAAFLRIKFTPLLSKVSSGNIDSRCCIEIVPELSGIQNLDKIDWKSEKDQVEYKIPMTYKITIKKQNLELQNKVYHSCVDLLPAYSMSNHELDFASGDVKRVNSDNLFVLNLKSCSEKYDLVPTKNLLTPEEKPDELNIERCKAASIQTLETIKPSNHRSPGVDFEVNTNIKSDVRVVRSEETLKGDIDKYDIETNTIEPAHENEIKFVKPNITNSLDDIFKKFTETHRKLSLSPICSVNTWDALPPVPTYITKNSTSSYIFSNCDSTNKGVMCNMGYPVGVPTNFSNIENSNLRPRESSRIAPIYETRTYVTLKFDDINRAENRHVNKTDKFVHANLKEPSSVNLISNKHLTYKDITTSMSHVTRANFSRTKNNNLSSGCDSNNSYDSRNSNKVEKLCKTMELLNNKKQTNFLDKKQPNIICTAKKGTPLKNDSNVDTLILRIEPRVRTERATPAARVASLLKSIETEIYPLKKRLHDIKCKCVVLGLDLFGGEFTPCSHKSIMYQPVPNFDYLVEESSEQRNDHGKSNRVVYSVLFNG